MKTTVQELMDFLKIATLLKIKELMIINHKIYAIDYNREVSLDISATNNICISISTSNLKQIIKVYNKDEEVKFDVLDNILYLNNIKLDYQHSTKTFSLLNQVDNSTSEEIKIDNLNYIKHILALHKKTSMNFANFILFNDTFMITTNAHLLQCIHHNNRNNQYLQQFNTSTEFLGVDILLIEAMIKLKYKHIYIFKDLSQVVFGNITIVSKNEIIKLNFEGIANKMLDKQQYFTVNGNNFKNLFSQILKISANPKRKIQMKFNNKRQLVVYDETYNIQNKIYIVSDIKQDIEIYILYDNLKSFINTLQKSDQYKIYLNIDANIMFVEKDNNNPFELITILHH